MYNAGLRDELDKRRAAARIPLTDRKRKVACDLAYATLQGGIFLCYIREFNHITPRYDKTDCNSAAVVCPGGLALALR